PPFGGASTPQGVRCRPAGGTQRAMRPSMNWFEELTGFPEPDYATVRGRLAVDGHDLVVRGSSRRYGIGELELVSLAELRERAVQPGGGPGRTRLRIVKGEVRQMHRQPQYAGALFQVAS